MSRNGLLPGKRFAAFSVAAVLFAACGPGLAEGEALCTDFGPEAVARVLDVDLERKVERRDDRPNVVIIIADDMGYADLGSYGGEIPTPNLDRLAEEGAKFTEGYAASAVCAPSRAGLMTGKQPGALGFARNLAESGGRFGDVPTLPPEQVPSMHEDPGGPFKGNASAYHHFGLATSEKTIADYFREEGYATGFVGKWHLGDTSDYAPKARGFDEYYHFSGGYYRYNYYFRGGHYLFRMGRAPVKKISAGKAYPSGTNMFEYVQQSCGNSPEYHYRTDVEGLEATRFILRHRDRPFLLYLSSFSPHWPSVSREESIPTYFSYYRRPGYLRHVFSAQRRSYMKSVIQLDQAVGRVLDTLDLLGLTENTVVWFFSDNGGDIRYAKADNGPLRGTKGDVYEGGVRVPFLLRWPRVVSPGVYEWPVSLLDVLPTSLAAAGRRSGGGALDGVDLLPHLERGRPPSRDLYWRHLPRGKGGKSNAAVRSGDWKLVSYINQAAEYGAEEYNELFNLKSDVGEQRNLAEEESEILRSLREKLTGWADTLPQVRW